jgi:hypothetical protein
MRSAVRLGESLARQSPPRLLPLPLVLARLRASASLFASI